MSLQYPKVKSGEEEKYHTAKLELNRIKQISIGVESITETKPDIP
jgi:hypothetical protein